MFFRETLAASSIDCIFTSPNPIHNSEEYIETFKILAIECQRVLKPTGSMWVHMEDRFNEQGSLE